MFFREMTKMLHTYGLPGIQRYTYKCPDTVSNDDIIISIYIYMNYDNIICMYVYMHVVHLCKMIFGYPFQSLLDPSGRYPTKWQVQWDDDVPMYCGIVRVVRLNA